MLEHRGAPIDAGRAALRRPTELTVKLDGDLFLPAHYFEWVAATFARDPRAGNGHLSGARKIDDAAARDSLRSEQAARMRGLLRGARHTPESALAGGGPALWITGSDGGLPEVV